MLKRIITLFWFWYMTWENQAGSIFFKLYIVAIKVAIQEIIYAQNIYA